MRPWRDDIIQEACEFAARWGFLTQSLFFEFMCPMSRAHKFRYWNSLLESGKFIRSKSSDKILILSAKGRNVLGGNARPARQSIYIAHDSVAARVILSLTKRDLISKYWLEDELMRNPIEAYSVLGGEQVLKIPDVVLDLKSSGGGTIRCSLEIEKTTKPIARYAKIALAYLGYKKVSVMLFAVDNTAAENTLRRSFSGKAFVDKQRVPGLFNLNEFKPDDLETKIRFNDQELTFKNLLSRLTKLEIKPLKFSRDDKETAVSLKIVKNQEAA